MARSVSVCLAWGPVLAITGHLGSHTTRIRTDFVRTSYLLTPSNFLLTLISFSVLRRCVCHPREAAYLLAAAFQSLPREKIAHNRSVERSRNLPLPLLRDPPLLLGAGAAAGDLGVSGGAVSDCRPLSLLRVPELLGAGPASDGAGAAADGAASDGSLPLFPLGVRTSANSGQYSVGKRSFKPSPAVAHALGYVAEGTWQRVRGRG